MEKMFSVTSYTRNKLKTQKLDLHELYQENQNAL
jgi:hypothetical protein